MQRCLAIWVLMMFELGLTGCGTTNTALDATSLYSRGQNQNALEALSEAKSNTKMARHRCTWSTPFIGPMKYEWESSCIP